MTDKQYIMVGCATEWERTLGDLRKIADVDTYRPPIRDKAAAEKLINTLIRHLETLKESFTLYHNLCPSPNQPSQTAASKDVT